MPSIKIEIFCCIMPNTTIEMSKDKSGDGRGGSGGRGGLGEDGEDGGNDDH